MDTSAEGYLYSPRGKSHLATWTGTSSFLQNIILSDIRVGAIPFRLKTPFSFSHPLNYLDLKTYIS